MKCNYCGIEFKKRRHWQIYCSVRCRNNYHNNSDSVFWLEKREEFFRKEFDTLNYRDDPVNVEPHKDLERSCQLQTVISTGLYIPYKKFDDQEFIGVKNLSFCAGCTVETNCKKNESEFYPNGCEYYLRKVNRGYQEAKEETILALG